MEYLLKNMKTAGIVVMLSVICTPVVAMEVMIKKFTDSVYTTFVHGSNGLVVIGDDGVLITDPSDTARAEALKAEIAKLTDKPVTKIVLSHEHTDHVGGTEVFKNAEIIAQSNVKSVFMLDQTGLVPKKVDVYFDTEYVVDMGATRVELKHFGVAEGHANIVVYLPDESLVLLTDLYDAEKELMDPEILDATNLVGVRKVFQEVSKWRPRYVVTGHSTNTDPRLMYEYTKFMNDLYNAVYPHLEQHFNDPWKLWEEVQALPKKVTLPAYKGWENYQRFLPGYVYRMAYSLAYGG